MNWEANCGTTAMGILPHTNIERALELALGFDVPFWPQLPLASFYEDMFAQVSIGFPGITVDDEKRRVSFDTGKFYDGLDEYAKHMEDTSSFRLRRGHSLAFHKFLDTQLNDYPAIRGQVTGAVNFGFRIMDEKRKPIIYNEDVRSILFDFIRRKLNVQYEELARKNGNAFVWVDEPGLGWVFTSFSGYNDLQAREDYHDFLKGIKGPRAIHLCLNVNLPYLLSLGLDVLSIDAYQLEIMPRGYTHSLTAFLETGGIMSWGIVPTCSKDLQRETPETLAGRLIGYWDVIAQNTQVSVKKIAQQALIAPARCCIKSVDTFEAGHDMKIMNKNGTHFPETEEKIVEQAFSYVHEISSILKQRFHL